MLTLPTGDGGTKTRFLLQNVRVLAVGATALTNRTAQGAAAGSTKAREART